MADNTANIKVQVDDNDLKSFTDEIKGLKDSTDKAGDSFGGLKTKGDGLKSGLTALKGPAMAAGAAIAAAGAAALAAVAGTTALVASFAQSADESIKMARAMGMNVESFTALDHAMKLGGTSMEEQRGAFAALSTAINDNSDKLRNLGIATRNANGEVRSTQDVLADVADRFQGMEDGAQKTAEAVALFGESGAAMISTLNQGSEGLEAMTEQAAELGLVLSTESAQAAEAFNDRLSSIKGSMEGVKNTIGTALLPSFSELAGRGQAIFQRLQQAVGNNSDAIKELGERVSSFVSGAATFLIRSVGAIIGTFLQLRIAFNNVISGIANLVSNFIAMMSSLDSAIYSGISNIIDFLAEAASKIPGVGSQIAESLNSASDSLDDMATRSRHMTEQYRQDADDRRRRTELANLAIRDQQRAVAGLTADLANLASTPAIDIPVTVTPTVAQPSTPSTGDTGGSNGQREEQEAGMWSNLVAIATNGANTIRERTNQIYEDSIRRKAELTLAAAQAQKEQQTLEYEAEVAHNQRLLELRQSIADSTIFISQRTMERMSEMNAKQLEEERQRIEQRDQAVLGGARGLASTLMSVEGKNRKERLKALKKGLGQELVAWGAQMLARGIGDIIGMNYASGAARIAGGTAMIVAGKKMGGSGGGGGGGGGRMAPRQEPQASQNVTINQTTSFGFVGDRRAAARDVSRENQRAIERGINFRGRS